MTVEPSPDAARPARAAFSPRTLIWCLGLMAAYLGARLVLEDWFGRDDAGAIVGLIAASIAIWACLRAVLDPERTEGAATPESSRRIRRLALAGLIASTLIAALALQSILSAGTGA